MPADLHTRYDKPKSAAVRKARCHVSSPSSSHTTGQSPSAAATRIASWRVSARLSTSNPALYNHFRRRPRNHVPVPPTCTQRDEVAANNSASLHVCTGTTSSSPPSRCSPATSGSATSTPQRRHTAQRAARCTAIRKRARRFGVARSTTRHHHPYTDSTTPSVVSHSAASPLRHRPPSVTGIAHRPLSSRTILPKTHGGNNAAASTTQPMPSTVISPSERNAGWRAMSSVPMPTNMITAEITIPRR